MDQRPANGGGPGSDPVAAQGAAVAAEAFLPVQAFLSLFLVLLAFFIVLTSMSQPEAGRAVKAIASVRATFPSDLVMGSVTGEETNLFVAADRTLDGQVGRLLDADVPVAPPRRDPSSGAVGTEIPVDALFEGAGLTRVGEAFVAKAAALVANPPEGYALSVTALVPDGDDALATRRAIRLARALIEAGTAEAAVTAGVMPSDAKTGQSRQGQGKPGDGKSARFLFLLRPVAGVPAP